MMMSFYGKGSYDDNRPATLGKLLEGVNSSFKIGVWAMFLLL